MNILIGIALIFLIVVIHEAGHYLSARIMKRKATLAINSYLCPCARIDTTKSMSVTEFTFISLAGCIFTLPLCIGLWIYYDNSWWFYMSVLPSFFDFVMLYYAILERKQNPYFRISEDVSFTIGWTRDKSPIPAGKEDVKQ